MNVFIFGDQTADQVPLLRKIVAKKDNSLLSTFLERSSIALREEIQRLPKTQRDSYPDFLTISQLVELYHEKGTKVPALESVLVTTAQLGHYIGYVSLLAYGKVTDDADTFVRTFHNCRIRMTSDPLASALACWPHQQ
jgi:Starter unit:ACP transacylase in aflatoxin biosynthesis